MKSNSKKHKKEAKAEKAGAVRGQMMFNSIFAVPVETAPSKGRNADKLAARNECIVARSYYYYEHKGMRYDLVVEMLVKEFWLTQRTVTHILSEFSNQLREMRKEKPPIKDLAKQWPHIAW